MSVLHTVNKSPFERDAFQSCLKYAAPGSSVLLFEDGVYAALKGTAIEEKLTSALNHLAIYVLSEDLRARGFSEERVVPGVKLVDYGGFVDLAAENDKVQAWL